jgi:hypothetical protein
MERRIITRVVIAFFFAFCLLATFALVGTQDYSQHFILAHVPHFIFGVVTIHSQKHYCAYKQGTINRSAKNNGKISIFGGRGAVRNRAIFNILVAAGPLSIGDIQRRLNRINGLEVTYYASLNKRIHALVRGGYIGEVKPVKAVGFKVCLYEVRIKFYLAYYLNSKSREEILHMLNEPNAAIILSELINAEITEA